MKKTTGILLAAILIVIIVLVLLSTRFFSDEDSWIKDERGVWVKHGNPSTTPSEVAEQQAAITKAKERFETFRVVTSAPLSSQCIGDVDGYALDIVHVPRTPEDNLPQNQCESYRNGSLSHFIEFDKEGNIVRIR